MVEKAGVYSLLGVYICVIQKMYYLCTQIAASQIEQRKQGTL